MTYFLLTLLMTLNSNIHQTSVARCEVFKKLTQDMKTMLVVLTFICFSMTNKC